MPTGVVQSDSRSNGEAAATESERYLESPARPLNGATFWDLVDWRADATGTRVMLLDEFERSMTFEQFRHAALVTAAGLADIGVGPGTKVAWQLPNVTEAAVLMAALSRLRAVQCPLVPIWRERELTFMLRQTEVDLLLTPTRWGRHELSAIGGRAAAKVGCRHVTFEISNFSEELVQLPSGDPSSLADVTKIESAVEQAGTSWIFYTSGTSSAPKGVRHSEASALASAVHLLTGLGYRTEDVDLLISPITHINGLMTLTAQLVVGSRLVLLSKFVPDAATKLARRHGLSLLRGPAAVVQAFVDAQAAAGEVTLFRRLRACQTGGSPIPDQLNRQVREVLGLPGAGSSYGMTECPGVSACSPFDAPRVFAATVGRPIPGSDVRVMKHGTECAAGEVGEVLVRGPQLFSGYVDESLNAAAFDEAGFYRSGDLGMKTPDGYLIVTGRLKDIIIRNGENISAAEVERVLTALPSIKEVAVIGIPDPRTGERCCAVVVPSVGGERPCLSDLTKHCEAAGLARQKQPESIFYVDELPRNAMGKVVKPELKRLVDGLAEALPD